MRSLFIALLTLATFQPAFAEPKKEEGGLLDGIGIWNKAELQRKTKDKVALPYNAERDRVEVRQSAPGTPNLYYQRHDNSDPSTPKVVNPTITQYNR